MLAMLLGMLNNTIVGTAMPTIARDLGAPVAAGPRGRAVIVVPFDPDAERPVSKHCCGSWKPRQRRRCAHRQHAR
jgi:hypothetical protein